MGGDTNGFADAFVRDFKTHKTKLISVSSAGTHGSGGSYESMISSNGRFVAFESDATNLVAGDGNVATDIFVRDLKTGKTRRVSLSSAGLEANGASHEPSVSSDGRFVAFTSDATNLVPGDLNLAPDAFVRDLKNHKTRRVDVSSAGVQASSGGSDPTISSDGRFVPFDSRASNLTPGDANVATDVFVRGPLHP